MLHEIFQHHGIPPDEVYAKNRRHRMFIYASMMLQLEKEAKGRQN